jgi:hypothetical protein
MEADVSFILFIFLAAALSGLIIHVVIIILGISPKRIIRIVYNGRRVSTLARRTCRGM